MYSKNKNAVKTGEFETIWLDTLDKDEKELVNQVDRRMLQRIQKLKEYDYTTVEITRRIE